MDAIKKQWKYYVSVFGISTAFLAFFYLYKKYLAKAIDSSTLHFNLYPLSKEDAENRSSIVNSDNLTYTLFLNLKDKNTMNNDFEGSVIIDFALHKVENLFLDFHGIVTKIVLNNKEISPSSYSRDRIYLSSYDLLKQNKVLIEFKSIYSNTEHGLRFIKSDDFNTYITSNFEPFYAHTVFPCFNQIDLKANIKLFLATHKEFEAISSGILLLIINLRFKYEFT